MLILLYDITMTSHKLRNAFRMVKKDINTLKAEVARLTKENELLIKIAREQTERLVGTKKASATAKSTFVASKNGGKFHRPTCPYAKNIKPKDKVSYKSKNAFLNRGYRASKCV